MLDEDFIEGFGRVSRHHRRQADEFFAELYGESSIERRSLRHAQSERSNNAEQTEPTIRLPSEVLVCVGGVNNATVRAVTTGTGTIRWSIGSGNKASVSATGNVATVRGRHPGVTTLRATLTSGGRTVTATARVLVIFIQLQLRNSGTIVRAPENEDEADERAAAGGTNRLGELPMGTGRADFPGTAYTAPCMVIGRVFPREAARRFTFRWQRLIHRRSWHIRRSGTPAHWTVTHRSHRGPLSDDTGAANFNDATPSPRRRLYIYDNSALALGGDAALTAGDFVHEKKDFIYRVWVNLNGTWTLCSAIHVGQRLTARRDRTTGTVATDWHGVENTLALRDLNARITSAEVRAIVGGTDPITIAAGANP